MFSRNKKEAIVKIKSFVNQGKNKPSPWGELKNQVFPGDEQFVERMLAIVDEQKTLDEIPKSQSRGKPIPLARIIHGVARISRRDLFSQWIFFSRRILIDICKRKNSLWNQRSSEMPSIP